MAITVNIAGVNLPVEKKVPYSLCYVYGIGIKRAFLICKELNIDVDLKMRDLSEADLARIRALIDSKYKVENDLKREKHQYILALKSIRCYKGLRHLAKLPVRGQRTQSNAKTRKKGVA